MTARFHVRIDGPRACGKTVLTKRLIEMLQDGPSNHFPVTIHDGEETVWDVDNGVARQRHRSLRRDYSDDEWQLIHHDKETEAKVAWEKRTSK
jgi:hypothetical protein